MIKKLNKNKKIIIAILGGLSLVTAVVTPIVIINQENDNEKETNLKQTKIIELKKHLSENLNLNLILPKKTNKDYDTDDKILIAIKKAFEERVGIDNSHTKYITKKINTNDVKSIVDYKNSSKTTYQITVDKNDYTLLLKQAKYTNQESIDALKNYLKTLVNLNVILPRKFVDNYNSDDKILNAIKRFFVTNLEITNSQANIITKKIGTNNITFVSPQGQGKTSYEIKINQNDYNLSLNRENITNNSNITDGGWGRVFQDHQKNIWAMGHGTKLQVLKMQTNDNYASSWTNDNNVAGLLNGSNITNGRGGFIFQDHQKNLWAMGFGTKLQVLKMQTNDNYASSWINDNSVAGLLNGSNITNGRGGFIFQDHKKNLWAIGFGTKLQVLKMQADGNYASSWTNDNSVVGLLNGSKIINGYTAKIFQDHKKNLWAMGRGSKLQVLKMQANGNYASSWTNDNNVAGLLNNSNITNGQGGFIFQDHQKNLWAMGSGTKLQVLKMQANGNYVASWINDNGIAGLLNGSNITNGAFGTIFQDHQKNLWAKGSKTKLQVLKMQVDGNYASSWTNDNSVAGLLNGSKITDGQGGFIFQDHQKNLWSMGNFRMSLQVLKMQVDGNYAPSWTYDNNVTGLLKGFKITSGGSGTGGLGSILQDHQKNLWIISKFKKLQVLETESNKKTYASKWTSSYS